MRFAAMLIAAALLAGGCQKKSDEQEPEVVDLGAERVKATPKPRGIQVPPPDSVGTIPPEAARTASGVAYRQTGKEGSSTEKPGPNDTVLVRYTAWRPDGTTQFTSKQRKRPQKMSLATTGPGWREAMQQMSVGETWLLWMTPQLAFGERAARAPDEILTYEVELIGIEEAPEVPEDVTGIPEGATRTDSGLAYRVLKKGTGTKKPRAFDGVAFHFTGWTTAGVMVDSSVVRGKPRKSLLFREMAGWQEGLQTMVVGEKKRFWIPEPLTRTAKWKPRGMLVYDIELLELQRKEPPWPVPEDVAAAPEAAETLPGGIAKLMVSEGSGTERPGRGDIVQVRYCAWTTDGQMFDCSVVNGEPATVPMGRIIPGWTQAMSTMVEGERARFWIPEKLAYRGRPGPQGTIVMEIEMVDADAKGAKE